MGMHSLIGKDGPRYSKEWPGKFREIFYFKAGLSSLMYPHPQSSAYCPGTEVMSVTGI